MQHQLLYQVKEFHGKQIEKDLKILHLKDNG